MAVLRTGGGAPDDLGRAALQQALLAEERVHGPESPHVAAILADLGLVHWDMGDLDRACEALTRASDIFSSTLGSGHPHVATVLNNYGDLLRTMGYLDIARGALEHALAIEMDAFGGGDVRVGVVLANLGHLEAVAGNRSLARSLLQRAHGILAAGEGGDGPDARHVGRLLSALARSENRDRAGADR